MPGFQASTSSLGGSCKTTMGMSEFVEILFSLSSTSMAERSSLVDNGSSGCDAARPLTVNQPIIHNATAKTLRQDRLLAWRFARWFKWRTFSFELGLLMHVISIMQEVPNPRGRIL